MMPYDGCKESTNKSSLLNGRRPVGFLPNTLSLSTTSTSGSSVGKMPPARWRVVDLVLFLILLAGVELFL